jgi:hypothetical protein
MELNEKQLADWRETRRRGFLHFIFIQGVLGWGGGMAIFFSIGMYIVDGLADFSKFIGILKLSLIFFPIGGLVMSYWQWTESEAAYEAANLREHNIESL